MIGCIPCRLLVVGRGTNPALIAGSWERHRYFTFGYICQATPWLVVVDCCVYIEVTGCQFYDLSEENSMLPITGSSFKHLIIITRGAFKYDVFYPVVKICLRNGQ